MTVVVVGGGEPPGVAAARMLREAKTKAVDRLENMLNEMKVVVVERLCGSCSTEEYSRKTVRPLYSETRSVRFLSCRGMSDELQVSRALR